MSSTITNPVRYPYLEALLEQKGLRLLGIYGIRDAANILGVSTRTIQEWVRDRKLLARDLPGRGRFLSDDLELFLQSSLKNRQEPKNEGELAGDSKLGRGPLPARQVINRHYSR